MSENKRVTKSDLTKVDAHVIQPHEYHEYNEAPEFTAEQLARAELRIGDKIIRRGRPPLDEPKQAVKLRLDADVLARWRASGPGWQTRINTALRRAAPKRRRRA